MKERWSEHENFWKIDRMNYRQLWLFEKYMDFADFRDLVINRIAEWRRKHIQWVHVVGKNKTVILNFLSRFHVWIPQAKRYTD